MITEKQVTRYEAVCDDCGCFIGEYSDRKEARDELSDHRQRSIAHRAVQEGRMSRESAERATRPA